MRNYVLTRPFSAALGGLLVLPATAFGANGEGTPLKLSDAAPKAAAEHTGSGAATLIRTIVGLAVVLAVIYGITWVMRQVVALPEPALSDHHGSLTGSNGSRPRPYRSH